uniref:Uncharacterized protein n=1 Tax=Glypta fumiferanae TaxID=389681 RepID=A0A0F6QA66_9HYME|nr:hypothetical protein [Glypta fumiferanae]
MAAIFEDIAKLFRAAEEVGEAARLEEGFLKDLVGRRFPGVDVAEKSGIATLTVGGKSMTLSEFVKGVVDGDESLIGSLQSKMSVTQFEEVSRGFNATRGVTNYTAESLEMMSEIREPIANMKLPGAKLTEFAKSEESFSKMIKSLDTSVESNARLAERIEQLETALKEARPGSQMFIKGGLFALAITATVGLTAYMVCDHYAKKHSGCYMINRMTKERCRINLLSKSVGSAEEQCYSDVKLTKQAQSSKTYREWSANKSSNCNPQLCRNDQLVAPYNDEKQYSISCVKLDAIDAACDIASDAGHVILDAMGSIVSTLSKALLPVAVTCGGLYVIYRVMMKAVDYELSDEKTDSHEKLRYSRNPKKHDDYT